MKAETVPLGERLIAQETDLDRQFAGKTATPASLQAATAEIGATHDALRFANLRYHLLTLDTLSPAQMRLYGDLAGMGSLAVTVRRVVTERCLRSGPARRPEADPGAVPPFCLG